MNESTKDPTTVGGIGLAIARWLTARAKIFVVATASMMAGVALTVGAPR